jgi:hypothetical protein
LTVLSTLGLKEHYLIDLVVAVPFVVFVYALPSLSEGGTAKRSAALGGALLTVLLMAVIYFAGESLRHAPWIATALSLSAIVISLVLHVASEPQGTIPR